jgi:sulfur relay (sulfurtransferase) DsrC/TusE family protein
LELDQEIIVQINKFLKEQKSSQMGKGLWEALYWLREFIQYFEIDYNMAIEEYKDILHEADENLSEDDRFIK